MASEPKIVAEWQSEEGTRFLVRTQFTSVDDPSFTRERYETEEVTPDVVGGMDVLEAWREFQETRPKEWNEHNNSVLRYWEKEKLFKREKKMWCFTIFSCLCSA